MSVNPDGAPIDQINHLSLFQHQLERKSTDSDVHSRIRGLNLIMFLFLFSPFAHSAISPFALHPHTCTFSACDAASRAHRGSGVRLWLHIKS